MLLGLLLFWVCLTLFFCVVFLGGYCVGVLLFVVLKCLVLQFLLVYCLLFTVNLCL